MEYVLNYFNNRSYIGQGASLRDAIVDALRQVSETLPGLEAGRAWCVQFVRLEVTRRKEVIFSKTANYDDVELIEMLAEARDYRISGSTAAGRYPLAQALAVARGVTTVTVLTTWGNAFAAAFAQLATLIDRQDKALDAIQTAADPAALREVMATILEQLG